MLERKESRPEASKQNPDQSAAGAQAQKLRGLGTIGHSGVSGEERLAMIRDAAYFRAERRGFDSGAELEDWLEAEKEVNTTLELRGRLERVRMQLERERDELRVKMHLAKLEVRAEWDAIEGKWAAFRAKTDSAAHAARHSGREVASAAGLLLEEIRDGYRRIRRAL